MKKKYFYIIVLFAIIPLLAWIAFNEVTEAGEKYVITNESGDRKELGNVRFNSYDCLGDYKVNKVSIGSNGVEVSNADYIHNYASYKNILENKDLLRGKDLGWKYNNPEIDENSEYTVYASIESFVISSISKYETEANIKLNIKNKKSGNIIRINYNVKSLNKIKLVKIIGNFVEVIIEGGLNSSDKDSYDHLTSYKFELNSGKLIDEKTLVENIPSEIGVISEGPKVYILINKDNIKQNQTSYMLIYDTIHDKITRCELPKGLKEYQAIVNNGVVYCPIEDTVVGIDEDGKISMNFKLDKDMKDFQNVMINDDKIYLVKDSKFQTTGLIGKKLSVYSLKNNSCLYSAQINIYHSDYLCSDFEVK